VRLLRGLLGALLWLLAAVLGLVGFILCVTVILLPIGIPLLMLARRLFTKAVQLMLPRSMAHPVEELGKAARKKGRKTKKNVPGATDVLKKGRKPKGKLPDAADVVKKGRKAARRQRKRLL
jgi:hypothetical protein